MLSICIPYYSKPVEIVMQAIESAARAMTPDSELLVLPHGPEACARLRTVTLPASARIAESEETLTMVSSWNRCLDTSSGELVHILHDDDVVRRGFYEAILELRRRFPDAALYSTGFEAMEIGEAEATAPSAEPPVHFQGDDAARFILVDERHFPGAIVMTRRAIQSTGGFREEFPYTLDDEAFPRYASVGGIAFDPAPLYGLRTHELQTRHGVWRRSDMVSDYVRTRVEGASHFSDSVVEETRASTARRVISVAVTLSLEGQEDVASRQLTELRAVVPECRTWPRYWLARATARSRLLRRAAAYNRKVRARRSVGSGVAGA